MSHTIKRRQVIKLAIVAIAVLFTSICTAQQPKVSFWCKVAVESKMHYSGVFDGTEEEYHKGEYEGAFKAFMTRKYGLGPYDGTYDCRGYESAGKARRNMDESKTADSQSSYDVVETGWIY